MRSLESDLAPLNGVSHYSWPLVIFGCCLTFAKRVFLLVVSYIKYIDGKLETVAAVVEGVKRGRNSGRLVDIPPKPYLSGRCLLQLGFTVYYLMFGGMILLTVLTGCSSLF